MVKTLRIAVLLGGPSAEREVSLRTGAAAAKALRSLGHEVFEIDPADGKLSLPPETDVAFLALHGTYGEDGVAQGQLERLGVPYTGCDPESSRIAFDKVATKRLCQQAGVPTAPFRVFDSADAPPPAGWNPPWVIKPIRQGSSVGLQFVHRFEEWSEALRESLRHDTEVLVEEKIEGREVTVAVLDDEALPIVEIRPKQGEFDYRNKYTAGATEYLCPAPFSPEITARIQDAALGAFRAVNGRDYGRIDVMVRANGDPVVLEVNTLPGMTETSLFPKAAAAAGISYAELCQRMIDLALGRARDADLVRRV